MKKHSKSLNHKIVRTIVCFVSICIFGAFLMLSHNMEQRMIAEAVSDEQVMLESVAQAIDKTSEVCSFAVEVVQQTARVNDYMELLHDGSDLDMTQKLEFYQQELSSIENMSNSNPYLYQVRIYVNSESASEKSPCLFRYDRMASMSWSSDYEDDAWRLDYADTVFPDYITTATPHLAGLLRVVTNADGEEIYTIECATYMTSLFPELYENSDSSWSAFYTDDGACYHVTDEDNKWNALEESVSSFFEKETDVTYTKLNGHHVILAYMQVPQLHGTYVHLLAMDEQFSNFYKSLLPYGMLMLFILLAFVAFSIVAVRIIMRQDNLDRQLLAKNAQIKSLQNQINAHFLYNVLESIKMMAEIEEKYEISDAITSLGNLLRYSMKWMTGTVTVEEELVYIRNYLKLLNLRFDYEIYLSLNLPDEIRRMEIPKLLLQPLVENAVYHGIEEMAQDTNIYIKGQFVSEQECTIEVADAGRGMSDATLAAVRDTIYSNTRPTDENGHGIGLRNVQDRVQLYFGERYGIEIFSMEDCYTKVLIHLPRKKEGKS